MKAPMILTPMPDSQALRKEYDDLAAQVRYHEAAYRAGAPEVTDAVFDELFDRYQELDEEDKSEVIVEDILVN